MSVLSADPVHWVPLAVLAASLSGSAHCVSMCGGIVLAAARTPLDRLAYHLGRLAGYAVLGALAGALGSQVLDSGLADGGVAFGAALLMGLLFVVAAVRVWQGRPPHFSVVSQSVLDRLYRQAGSSAWLTGALTALLPCGWLHVFVLSAAATRGALSGAGLLLVFWLGTLPALTAAPWLLERVFGPLSRRSPRIAAILLLLAGALSVGSKILPKVNPQAGTAEEPACHHDSGH